VRQQCELSWRTDLVVVLDSHAHCVDEYRQQNGTLEVAMIDDEFQPTSQTPQAQTQTRTTYTQPVTVF